MNRVTISTFTLLAVLCFGSSIRGQHVATISTKAAEAHASTPLTNPQPPSLPAPVGDAERPDRLWLCLDSAGIRIATNSDEVEQLRKSRLANGAVVVACRELSVTGIEAGGKSAVEVVCHRADFGIVRGLKGPDHRLNGRAEVLKYNSESGIRLCGAELTIDRHGDGSPDRITANEISIDLNDLGVTLRGVRIAEPIATKGVESEEHVPAEPYAPPDGASDASEAQNPPVP